MFILNLLLRKIRIFCNAESVAKLISRVCCKTCHDKIVFRFRWTFNPAVLTKVSGPVGLSDAGNNLSPNGVGGLDSGHHFAVGDLVQICSDMERMKVRFTVCN